MNTITCNHSSQNILTIDDSSLVNIIVSAVKMIKGVSAIKIQKGENRILDSASYKATMVDVKKGNVTIYKSADDMFNSLMNEP